jgi:hypothetical protein
MHRPLLLKCSETRKRREQFFSIKWLVRNDEVAYKRLLINCTNVVELRDIGKYLYKIRCKWENKIVTYNWKWRRGIEV